jgi:hypothetical protein
MDLAHFETASIKRATPLREDILRRTDFSALRDGGRAQEMADTRRHGQGEGNRDAALARHGYLSAEQREAVSFITGERQIEALTGFAGAGKSAPSRRRATPGRRKEGYGVLGGACPGLRPRICNGSRSFASCNFKAPPSLAIEARLPHTTARTSGPENREDCLNHRSSIISLKNNVLDNICLRIRNLVTVWDVEFHRDFDPDFDALPEEVQDEIRAHAGLLEQFGHRLGRPRADTLKGSRHANMKELRFDAADGVWRIAFAFDPKRKAVLLVAGDKSGPSEKRFYRQLTLKR